MTSGDPYYSILATMNGCSQWKSNCVKVFFSEQRGNIGPRQSRRKLWLDHVMGDNSIRVAGYRFWFSFHPGRPPDISTLKFSFPSITTVIKFSLPALHPYPPEIPSEIPCHRRCKWFFSHFASSHPTHSFPEFPTFLIYWYNHWIRNWLRLCSSRASSGFTFQFHFKIKVWDFNLILLFNIWNLIVLFFILTSSFDFLASVLFVFMLSFSALEEKIQKIISHG